MQIWRLSVTTSNSYHQTSSAQWRAVGVKRKLFIFRVHARRIRRNRSAFGLTDGWRTDFQRNNNGSTDDLLSLLPSHCFRFAKKKTYSSKSRSSLTRTCRARPGVCCRVIAPVVADYSPSTRKQHKFIPRENNEKLNQTPVYIHMRVTKRISYWEMVTGFFFRAVRPPLVRR